jgi:hypothetical protein
VKSKLIATEIKKGETIETVKQKLGLGSPTRLPDPDRLIYHYHLPELGFWVFFNESGIVYSIRFEAPFPDSIEGVLIGDSKDQVIGAIGKPQRLLPMPDSRNRWLYDKLKIRVDFNDKSELVEKVFRI